MYTTRSFPLAPSKCGGGKQPDRPYIQASIMGLFASQPGLPLFSTLVGIPRMPARISSGAGTYPVYMTSDRATSRPPAEHGFLGEYVFEMSSLHVALSCQHRFHVMVAYLVCKPLDPAYMPPPAVHLLNVLLHDLWCRRHAAT
jgi:hypothetical protein